MKSFKFTIDGHKYDATVNELEGDLAEVTVNGSVFQVEIEREQKKAAPKVAAPKPAAAAAPAAAPAPKAADVPAGGTKVVSPLPGSIIKVLVSEGQAVKKGDTLLTLESMKMENAITADVDGTVAKIAVAAGQTVMQDDLLVVLN
ncbi:MAG: biotin/lipoyl-binding protein [Paludibacteraceae bacterium]|nr:biotin/lipoyl-binding protein [Paludibacteraceae bacterium]